MRSNKPIVFSLFVIGVFMAQGAMADIAPFRVPAELNDQILIKGFKGNIEYSAVEGAKDVHVEVTTTQAKETTGTNDWQFSFNKEGQTIALRVEGPLSKKEWAQVLQTGVAPSYNLKLTGPNIPVSIYWHEGNITVSSLQNEVRITNLNGDIQVTGGSGDSTISTHEGSVVVKDRKGKALVDSYLAKVSVEGTEGDINLDNFAGESKLTKTNGDIEISSFKGTSRVVAGKGKLSFKNGNAPLHIQDFEGEIRGRTDQGAVFADVKGDPDVHVESNDGAVNLKLADSGAWVNLGTAEGNMAVPGNLKLTRSPNQQIRSGRLNKGSGGGSVFIRTQTGDIQVR